MSAWLQVEDEPASDALPPRPASEPVQSDRPAWLAPLLMCSALVLIAVVMLVIVPNALGASAGGGCGGG